MYIVQNSERILCSSGNLLVYFKSTAAFYIFFALVDFSGSRGSLVPVRMELHSHHQPFRGLLIFLRKICLFSSQTAVDNLVIRHAIQMSYPYPPLFSLMLSWILKMFNFLRCRGNFCWHTCTEILAVDFPESLV